MALFVLISRFRFNVLREGTSPRASDNKNKVSNPLVWAGEIMVITLC